MLCRRTKSAGVGRVSNGAEKSSVQRDNNGGARASRVLLVDDERDLVDLLAFLVEQAGFVPVRAVDPPQALEALENQDPVIAVIDLNLSHSSGFDLISEIRRRRPKIPIIVLTARGSEGDKVRALDMGADDYVVKPFAHRELIARIRAQARRAEPERTISGQATLEVGMLHLDLQERRVLVDGGPSMRLTGTEFRLLECLMRNADSVVGTEILTRYVWGYNDLPAREAMRVTVYRLRRKLSDDGSGLRIIETIPGVGLRLRVAQPEQANEPSL
jgi:DNA-binding response OmpR family regulator